jgi:hypothetical protein
MSGLQALRDDNDVRQNTGRSIWAEKGTRLSRLRSNRDMTKHSSAFDSPTPPISRSSSRGIATILNANVSCRVNGGILFLPHFSERCDASNYRSIFVGGAPRLSAPRSRLIPPDRPRHFCRNPTVHSGGSWDGSANGREPRCRPTGREGQVSSRDVR